MVKCKGPLLSQTASGKLADVLSFAATKRGSTLRRSPRPKQPRSPLQVSFRAMLSFLCQQWNNLSTLQQSSWDAAFPGDELNRYNSFTKYNIERLRSLKGPTKKFPPTEDEDTADEADYTATGGVRHIVHQVQAIDELEYQWGVLIFRGPIYDELLQINRIVHLQLAEELGTFTWTEAPLDAGVHEIIYAPFTDEGTIRWEKAVDRTATVT